MTEFVRYSVPGWPESLTLERFLLHMTTHHPTLVKTIMLWEEDALNPPGFDILINPERRQEMKAAYTKIEIDTEKAFAKMNFTSDKTRRVLLSSLWFTGLPCKRMLVKCWWKNVEGNCDDIFHLIPTDIGFCCSFNHQPMEMIMNNSTFTTILRQIEKRYKSYDEGEKNDESAFPPITPQAGKQNGLRVLIDMKATDLRAASVEHNFNGIQAAVSNRDNFPVMITDSFLIGPGRETHVEVSAQRSSATADLKSSVEPEMRNCYFDDEFALNTFSAYTMTNCWVECLINLSRAEAPDKCVPWNFPTIDDTPCGPIQQHRFLEAYRSLDMFKIIGTEICLPNCAETVYTASVTSAPFRACDQANFGLSTFCTIDLESGVRPHKWAEIVTAAYGESLPDYISRQLESPVRNCTPKFRGVTVATAKPTYDAFEEDFAAVLFYFNRPFATELVTAPRMTWIVFFSRVGGLLGLFIGFSLISAIEIVYWLTLGWLENALEEKKSGVKKTSTATIWSLSEEEKVKKFSRAKTIRVH